MWLSSAVGSVLSIGPLPPPSPANPPHSSTRKRRIPHLLRFYDEKIRCGGQYRRKAPARLKQRRFARRPSVICIKKKMCCKIRRSILQWRIRKIKGMKRLDEMCHLVASISLGKAKRLRGESPPPNSPVSAYERTPIHGSPHNTGHNVTWAALPVTRKLSFELEAGDSHRVNEYLQKMTTDCFATHMNISPKARSPLHSVMEE